MDEPHFPKFQPKAPDRDEASPAGASAHAPIVVVRPEPGVETEAQEKPGFTRDEVRALLATTEVNAPRTKWSRSRRRATSFIALAVLGWGLDGWIGFWASTIVTAVLGLALFVWTIRPLWQQSEWD